MNNAVTKQKKELSLRQMVDIETRNRQIMTEFIANHMKKGVDYGGIHVNKYCTNKYECKIESHFSKDSLFKAGAEKVASLLKLRPEIEMDREAWEMGGFVKGLFFFKCKLYSRQTGELIAEGMGACSTEEKQGNPNNAIKIGKKRAFVDAVLSAGALSDFFTQDLEDMPQETGRIIRKVAEVQVAVADPVIDTEDQLVINDAQKTAIQKLLVKKGYRIEQLLKKYEVELLEQLTKEQADTILMNLRKLPDVLSSIEAPSPNEQFDEEFIKDVEDVLS